MKFKEVLGVDFGGSGIKAAPVQTNKGKLLQPRYRIETPMPATPNAVITTIKELVDYFNWSGPVGVGFPTVVLNGIVKTAANIDQQWIGVDAQELISGYIGLPTKVVNDADAAGMAEMEFGAGINNKGLVLLVTVGTGIGTVLFLKGKLVPNTEFGHIHLPNGHEAENYAADSARQREELEWDDWAKRFNEYLLTMESLLYPDLIIIGGGVSKKKSKFEEFLTLETKVVMAKQKNEAGIIGAALAAKKDKKNLLL